MRQRRKKVKLNEDSARKSINKNRMKKGVEQTMTTVLPTIDKSLPYTVHRNSPINGPDTTEGNIKFQCNICRSIHGKIADLEDDVECHINEVPYSCKFCVIDFVNLKKFCQHIANKHDDLDRPFSCPFCEATFRHPDEYHVHRKSHIDQGNECIKCGKLFPNAQLMDTHYRAHFFNKKLYECNECKRNFTRCNDLNLHKKSHQGLEVFECKYCDRIYTGTDRLNFHMDKEHFDGKREGKDPHIDNSSNPNLIHKFKCPLCDLIFYKRETVRYHCLRNHPDEFNGSVMDQFVEVPLRKQVIATILESKKECQICSLQFESRKNLIEHLKQSHNGDKPFKCLKCDLSFTLSDTLVRHITVHEDPPQYKCSFCSFTFIQKCSLVKHERRHVGTDVEDCKICGIPYGPVAMEKHIRIHCDDGKPHVCRYCDRKFSQSCDLVKHERIHRNDRRFSCNICGKTFVHFTSFKKHENVHTQQRDFLCLICGKNFLQKSNLTVHNRIHSGERPFKCKDCPKTFYASGHLSEHQKVHTGRKDYLCDVCNKRFSHMGSFKTHQLTHTGEKRYECLECNQKFTQRGHYTLHLRIHSGVKPYKCDVCGKYFRRSDALKVHMKRHDPVKRIVESEQSERPTENVEKQYAAHVQEINSENTATIDIDISEHMLPLNGGQIIVKSADSPVGEITIQLLPQFPIFNSSYVQ